MFFFFRKSASLKEFAACALNLCLESIKKYGRVRENYTLDFRKADQTTSDVCDIDPNSDFDFASQTQLVMRFTAIFNNILGFY